MAVATIAELAREARDVLSVPSFWVIVAQDAASQVPWSALTFMAMWLELVRLTHWETTVVTRYIYLYTCIYIKRKKKILLK